MQKVNRRKKSLKLIFFENCGEEIYDVSQAKSLLEKGEEIIAVGYVVVNGNEIIVRTSTIKEIIIFKNFSKVFTNSMEYVVNTSGRII